MPGKSAQMGLHFAWECGQQVSRFYVEMKIVIFIGVVHPQRDIKIFGEIYTDKL